MSVPFRGRRLAVGAAAAGIIGVLGLAVAAFADGIDGPAMATMPAVRGEAFRATDTVPPPPGCDRVVVIGDSLTDNSGPWLRAELAVAGHDYHVDAQPSRRIPGSVRAPYSGVRAALEARATFGEADCWVVALGSNDLVYGGGDTVAAGRMIDEMLAAITPGASVWWTNVNYHRDPRTGFDFVAATHTFNRAVDDRARENSDLHVMDWYSLSEAHLDWFFDPVHVDRTASIVRAEFTVAALPPAR